MNKIMRKLRSRSGASMLIAMVFMMFCVFIGGSVLSAASANGYRVAHLSDQQEYLNERSAALLLADELEPLPNTSVRLIIDDIKTTTQPVIIGSGGVVTENGEASESRSVKFQAPTGLKMTALQRLMFETTVWRYMKENGISTGQVTLVGFVYDDGSADGAAISSTTDFWCQYDLNGTAKLGGTIDITGTKNGSNFTTYQAAYSCGEGERLYDFLVNFGEYSQLTVSMNAFMGVSELAAMPELTNSRVESGVQYADQVTNDSDRTVISWNAPYIEKGGAEE